MDEARFVELVRRNPVVDAVLDRLPELGVADAWIVSGSLIFTVWNVEDGRDPTRGIKDYDVFYYDDTDISYEAEDRVIKRAAVLFEDLDADIEVRNQARVHLWFEKRNGIAYPPLRSSTDGIDRFLGCVHTLGVQPDGEGGVRVYAPYGFEDLTRRILQPNPKALGPASTYEEKAVRWRGHFPDMTIVPWLARHAAS